MILADSSAWVEYDRATGSPSHRRLKQLIVTEAGVATTQPVIAEVLIGARTDDRERQLRRLLSRFRLVPFEPTSDFDAAVTLYRRCRRAGVTPRGLVDCMIAAVALRAGAAVLAHDADFARMAEVVAVEMDAASLPPGNPSR